MVTEGCFAVVYALFAIILTVRFGYIGSCFALLAPTAISFGFYSVWCHRLLGLALPWRAAMVAAMCALLMSASVYASFQLGLNFFIVVLGIAPGVYCGTLYVLGAFPAEDILLLRRAILRESRAAA